MFPWLLVQKVGPRLICNEDFSISVVDLLINTEGGNFIYLFFNNIRVQLCRNLSVSEALVSVSVLG